MHGVDKVRQNRNKPRSREERVDRRRFVAGSAAAAAALAIRPSFAQETFPNHAITIVNPFPPGGANELVTRPFAAELEPILKQPIVIETKAGAAGQVGAQFVASAKPDGYTLLTHNTALAGFAEVDKLFNRTPKFTNADFIPIVRIVADPCVFVCNDQQPYKTLKDFIDDARKRPNEIIFSSAGLYSAVHLPMALFVKAAGGLQLRHLPTNGGGPAMTAVLGNNAQVAIISLSATLSQIKAGKLRPLALMGGKRSKAQPDVPTMKELGFDVEYYLWVGIFAPKNTPDSVITVLLNAANKAAHTDKFKTTLGNIGQELDYMDQPEFAKFWVEDAKKVKDAVDAIGRVQG
jgi:tripartite-type tricarboxylate transporter receptor subunit TctC